MRSPIAACVLFAFAVGAAACSDDHTGVSASPAFDPIGPEPTADDGDASPVSLLQSLCALSCDNVGSGCPSVPSNDTCATQCVASVGYFRGCEAEYLSYVTCQATTPVSCPYGYPMTPQCDPAAQMINTCLNRVPPRGL